MVPLPPDVYVQKYCRACVGTLEPFLALGNHRLNGFPKEVYEIELRVRVPLTLCVCTRCGLVQLDRTVPPDWMYRTYWYKSGVNEMMRHELRRIVTEACEEAQIEADDRVLDIGANDGTLLSYYPQGVYRVAVEPALNLSAILRPHCDRLVTDYWPHAEALEQVEGQFKIITAIACAYDTEDPLAFFQGIKDLLSREGIAIVQFQDFGQQLTAAAFDNVCHEHLLYYTCWSLHHIVSQVGLQIIDVLTTPINGGSLRVTLRHHGRQPPTIRVVAQLGKEASQHLDTPMIQGGGRSAFEHFRDRVRQAKAQITATLDQTFNEGRVVDVYGASTKGNILLQVLGIGPSLVRQAIDRSAEKVGRMTITGIPIVSEETAKINPADVWLCPIWQFRESVLTRERWYLDQGGTIIFPLPQVEIVRRSWAASWRPEMSAQPCGCDPGAGHTCERHR